MAASLEGLNVFCLLHRSCRSRYNALLRLEPPLEQCKNLKRKLNNSNYVFHISSERLAVTKAALLSVQGHHIQLSVKSVSTFSIF